jgi:hypothetical protein
MIPLCGLDLMTLDDHDLTTNDLSPVGLLLFTKIQTARHGPYTERAVDT